MIKTKTRSLMLLAIALAAITNHQYVQSQEQQLVTPRVERNLNLNLNLTYEAGNEHATYRQQALDSHSSNTSDTLETAPTITSVHQVWTSSSSGRLDELSPEMISKLRNDVPFLAAYALRPRLVGASPAPLISHLQAAVTPGGAGGARLDVAASSNADAKVAASSGRQLDGRSLAKLAGDFSEYNEETSSLSKSEHHHRRKTSVKRAQPETTTAQDGPLEFSSSSLRRRRVSSSGRKPDDKNGDALKQLVNRLKQRGKARTNKSNKLQKSASGNKRTSRGESSRRRRSKSSKARKADAFTQRRTDTRRTSKSGRLVQAADQLPSKANEEKSTGGDVKGGSRTSGPKRPPFYASTRPDQTAVRGDATTPKSSNAIDDNKLDSQPEAADIDEAEIDEEPREVEPKRVGDTDVEEDIGDTVLVEPKSDGVDDDPPLPDSLPDDDDEDDDDDADDGSGVSPQAEPRDNPRGSGSGIPGDREKEATTPMPKLAPEGDPRGNRVNRQKPNLPPAETDKTTEDDDDDNDNNDKSSGSSANGDGGGGSQVAGGGIGTTLGGGGGGGGGSNGGSDSASDSEDDDGNQPAGGSGGAGGGERGGGGTGATPGVEFAGDQGPDDERTPTGERNGVGGDSQFGDRRHGGSSGVAGSGGSRGGSGSGSGSGSGTGARDDYDGDLDYRDEMAEAPGKGLDRRPTDGHDQDDRKSNSGRDKTADGPATGGGGHSPGHGHKDHCDDGSYNHEHDHGGHHAHHDTIEWLRGAIPGEPDDDYPILSRVNTTNFRCADQKHPGYYADVDARCQIFHICQADGRQDSFLCPNGTIFSQRTLVCVWWNGFDCEDNIRRRRRRASIRQAPPKLKSRRVSRNSRRRKLRHGVKPRRRA